MSNIVKGTAVKSEAKASIVNRWMAGIAVVDKAAYLKEWKIFTKAY